MRPFKSPLPQAFLAKKKTILDQLSVPVSEYDDLSPKGSIDVGIRDLIDEINQIEGCVTTSSCSGRASVFLEGKKRASDGLLDDQVKEGGGKSGVRDRQDEEPSFEDESGEERPQLESAEGRRGSMVVCLDMTLSISPRVSMMVV